ncbi:unnamed protein product, partial [marine sediment metagenome]
VNEYSAKIEELEEKMEFYKDLVKDFEEKSNTMEISKKQLCSHAILLVYPFLFHIFSFLVFLFHGSLEGSHLQYLILFIFK